MKVAIFKDRLMQETLRKKGRKVVSHGTFREKRKPNSPRVRTARLEGQYHAR